MTKAAKPPAAVSQSDDEIAAEIARGADVGDDGTVTLDPEVVQEVGAVNPEAVRENRMRAETVRRKRGGEKGVPTLEDNACSVYDTVVQNWPPASLAFEVTRLTGTPLLVWLQGNPRNGRELYDALMQQAHKQSDEAEYKVRIRDSVTRYNRGVGRITLPNTRDTVPGPQQPTYAQPMQPQPYAPPPPYGVGAPPPYGQQPPPPQAGPQQPSVYMMPTPPPATASADLARLASLERELAELKGRLAAQPPAATAPAAPGPPPGAQMPAIPGLVWVPGYGYMPLPREAPSAVAPPPPSPPAPPQSAQQQFQGAIGVISSAVDAVRQASVLIPGLAPGSAPSAPASAPVDDPPIKVQQLGDIKAVVNEDGSVRFLDTALANLDKISDWAGKQIARIERNQKAANDAAAAIAAQQQQYVPPPVQQQAPTASQPSQAPAPVRGPRTMAAPTLP